MPFVINPYVHKASEHSRSEFAQRMDILNTFKVSDQDGLNFYIRSAREFNYIRHIKEAICESKFENLDHMYLTGRRHHFGIRLPNTTYSWIKNCDITTIYKQITCWLASLYSTHENKELMRGEIYKPLLQEIERLFNKYFFESNLDITHNDSSTEEKHKAYLDICKEYYKSYPPEVLSHPGSLRYSAPENILRDSWDINGRFSCKVKHYYLHESEYQNLVKNPRPRPDLLQEADTEDFQQWIHTFSSYDSCKKNSYSFFPEEDIHGFIYVFEQGSSGIFKIGFTSDSNIEKRKKALQTGNPIKLRIAGYFPCPSIKTERVIHSLFKSYRKEGEWFELSPNTVCDLLDETWRKKHHIY